MWSPSPASLLIGGGLAGLSHLRQQAAIEQTRHGAGELFVSAGTIEAPRREGMAKPKDANVMIKPVCLAHETGKHVLWPLRTHHHLPSRFKYPLSALLLSPTSPTSPNPHHDFNPLPLPPARHNLLARNPRAFPHARPLLLPDRLWLVPSPRARRRPPRSNTQLHARR